MSGSQRLHHIQEQENTSAYIWRIEPEIDAKRQKFLAVCLAIQPVIKEGIYPFKDVKLTRADIEWLLATHDNGLGPVDWSDPHQRERMSLDLRGADLRQVDLRHLPLVCMVGGLTRDDWQRATLEQRDLAGVHLERADLSDTHLEGALLEGAHLDGATLRGAFLQSANLFRAYLRNTYLRDGHFERAKLRGVHLEGAYLPGAYVQGSDLRNAFFDGASNLERITLSDEKDGSAALADVSWGDVNLAVIDWTRIALLGDEYRAHRVNTGQGIVKNRAKRLDDYRTAVRACRQLANAMRAQGMNEEVIPFAYRAQVLQRKVLWRQMLWGQGASLQHHVTPMGLRQRIQNAWKRIRTFGTFIFSCFLDVLAGYGYKPGRSLFLYLLMIAVFSACYFVLGHLSPREALIFSVTAFHGRGFLPGPFALSSPVTALAALEAVIGLFIEISFIATFTQRFLGR